MNKIKQTASAIGLMLPILFSAQTANAGENLWVYTKGTDTRPKGSFEFKLSDIVRVSKDSGHYRFHDIRPEIEYGITDKLTIGAEIMIFDHNYSVDDDIGPMSETQSPDYENSGFDPTGVVDSTTYGGFELALKYNILSPYKDFMGLSVGLGYEDRDRYRLDGSEIDQKSYTATIFMQKNWLDDTLTLAVNGKMELERRTGPGVLEEEIAFDYSVGLAYRVAPKHFIGIEYRRQEDHLSPWNVEDGQYDDPTLTPSEFDLFSDFQIGTRHQYGEYIGPSYHYAEKKWWTTVGILYQFNGGGHSENAYLSNGKNYDEHEKFHIGLTYGYEF